VDWKPQWVSILDASYAIPIMDGLNVDLAVSIGGTKPTMHALRAAPFFNESAISISNAKNLMDPVFVDNRHSSLMQVADVTAYLLHLLDWGRQNLPMTGEFKPRVAAVARSLDMSLVVGAEPIWMRRL
jgi:hypothetical protein